MLAVTGLPSASVGWQSSRLPTDYMAWPRACLTMAFASICGFSDALSCEAGFYALRGCSRALLAGSKGALASCSQVAAGGDRWLVMAVRGHLGGTLIMRRPRCSVDQRAARPSVFQVGQFPSRHAMWEYAGVLPGR